MNVTTRIIATILVFFMGIGHFPMSFTASPHSATVITDDIFPDKLSASFEITKGLIFVETILDGISTHFILDTGAPDIIINNRGQNIGNAKTNIKGINGDSRSSNITINEFNWNGLSLKNRSFSSIDLSHIESLVDRRVKGIIGFQSFKNYELTIDYKTQTIQLSKTSTCYNNEEMHTIPFRMNGHFPSIKARIGNQHFLMGLDTGAEVNLLHTTASSNLNSTDFRVISQDGVQGANKGTIATNTALVYQTSIQNESFKNMPYIFTDISHLNKNKKSQIDGLLGFPFFKDKKCVFDFQKQLFYISH